MIVEFHLNGKHQILLTPETLIERTILTEMASHAAKGKTVTLTAQSEGELDVAVVAVEK